MNLRLTAEELRVLERAAALSGVSRSEFVRLAIAAAAPTSSVVAPVVAPVGPSWSAAELLREAESVEAEHFGAVLDHPGTR